MTELQALTLTEWWCVHHKRDEDLLAMFCYAVDAVEWAAQRAGAGATVRRGGRIMWTVPDGPILTMMAICTVSDELRRTKRAV